MTLRNKNYTLKRDVLKFSPNTFLFNIERFYMYVCFNGGGGLCVWENISTVWSRYFARKDRPTLWRVKTQMLDKIFFQRVTVFTLFFSMLFFTYVRAEFCKELLAQVFLDFGCVPFLSGDKPQIFGCIVMKSGPRRWLNTSLLRLLYAR